ncbi:MAG TPA: hypothetical protein PKA06_10810, partial [Gemmatales bacterium]|nr:hypothetical protein [Gemmatales bacterium]
IEVVQQLREGQINLITRRAEMPSPFASQLLFSFTAAFMYDYDKVELKGQGNAASIDKKLLDQLLSPESYDHLLDPRAIDQVDKRLQGVGLLPRTIEELSEWIRRLGDVRMGELDAILLPMVLELEKQGRVARWKVPTLGETRWILTEEQDAYSQLSKLIQGEVSPDIEQAAERIVQRYLATHALVGRDDVQNRYPLATAWLEGLLKNWSRSGAVVSLEIWGDTPTVLYAAPANLDQVQRQSLALRRREIPTVPASAFAGFVERWQAMTEETAVGGPEGLRQALERLQGLSLPRELWEKYILPRRVPGYQTRWLDDIILSGEWCWIIPATMQKRDLCETVTFLRRDQLQHYYRPESGNLGALEEGVYDTLLQKGAMFTVDLAQMLHATPSDIKKALWN